MPSLTTFYLLLLLFLFLSYLFFVRLYPRSMRFWTVVEFIWFGAAALAPYPVLVKVRTLQADDQAKLRKLLVVGYATDAESLLMIRMAEYQERPDQKDAAIWAAAARIALSTYRHGGNESILESLLKSETFRKDPGDSVTLAALKDETLGDLKHIIDGAREVAALELKAQPAAREHSFMNGYWWMLTLALSLRIAKIAADYRSRPNRETRRVIISPADGDRG